MLEVFSRHTAIWLLFFVSNGILPLVNTIEGSFARSLVYCDLQVSKSPKSLFSGSAHCGDRLHVINEGQALSSLASSNESACKMLMMLITAVCTDRYGRKPVLLFGLSCTALSVFLFVLASCSPSWARLLFVMGQALQGAYPVELLFLQVAGDLASKEEAAQKMSIFELQGIVKTLPVVLFGFVATLVQALELDDYTLLWVLVLLANTGLIVATMLFFPETRPQPGGAACTNTESVLSGMKHELQEYRSFFTGMQGQGSVHFVLLYVLCDAISRGRHDIVVACHVVSSTRDTMGCHTTTHTMLCPESYHMVPV